VNNNLLVLGIFNRVIWTNNDWSNRQFINQANDATIHVQAEKKFNYSIKEKHTMGYNMVEFHFNLLNH